MRSSFDLCPARVDRTPFLPLVRSTSLVRRSAVHLRSRNTSTGAAGGVVLVWRGLGCAGVADDDPDGADSCSGVEQGERAVGGQDGYPPWGLPQRHVGAVEPAGRVVGPLGLTHRVGRSFLPGGRELTGVRVSSPTRQATVLVGAPTITFPRMREHAVAVACAVAIGATATDMGSEASTTSKVRRVARIHERIASGALTERKSDLA